MNGCAIMAICGLGGFSGNGVIVRLPKYVKRHVNGTYTRRNKEKKRSYSRYMRKKKRLQPIKIWHILGYRYHGIRQNQIFFCCLQLFCPIFNLQIGFAREISCSLWYQYLHVVVVQLDDALPTDAWGYTLFLDTFRIHARS